MSESGRLRLGFIPLNDAASVIVAQDKGFFAAEGLEVELSREVSWATVRDKVCFGALDGAHFLAPTVLAAPLGLAGFEALPLIAPLALSLNGPAVTVSSRLAAAVGQGPGAEGLARLVARRRQEGASPITFAVVFPYSVHNYLLRDWLAAAGIDPDRDVQLIVAPPSRMASLLADGVVEGFCVTEPWDTAAVAAGAGVIAVRGSQLWPRMPDKVFAVTEAWAEAHPETLQAALRALLKAAAWTDAAENRGELAQILSAPARVGAPAETIAASLSDLIFFEGEASAPAPVHAAWLLSQMVRWGHAPADLDIAEAAARIYRPDLYKAAAESLGWSPRPPIDALSGYGLAEEFRLADAVAAATRAPLSRIRSA